jgi:hypothetical protein
VTELTGKPFEIPESIDVRVVEETPDTLYLVLPSRERTAETPLTDDQLDAVAAGATGPNYSRFHTWGSSGFASFSSKG